MEQKNVKINFSEKALNPVAMECAEKIINDDLYEYKNYSLDEISGDTVSYYDWDDDEQDFIDNTDYDDLYFLMDRTVHPDGQAISLVAVKY